MKNFEKSIFFLNSEPNYHCSNLTYIESRSYLKSVKQHLPYRMLQRRSWCLEVARWLRLVSSILFAMRMIVSQLIRITCQRLRDNTNSSSVACRTLATAQKLVAGFARANAIILDVSAIMDLDKQVAAHDVVISLIPYIYHAAIIKLAIKSKTSIC